MALRSKILALWTACSGKRAVVLWELGGERRTRELLLLPPPLLTEIVLLRSACVVLGGEDRSSWGDGKRSGGERNPGGFRNGRAAGTRTGRCCGCEMAELLGGEAVRMHEEAERLKQ
ncbi:hypothetical protein V8E36_003120 [Tilletia maclaganii]